jgi:Zn-finger nucleic acid-binding protein
MRCPKCAAEMVTYERSGIHVDQCRECRGIFLDRGELERLVDAESNGTGWAGPQAPSSYPAVGGGYPGAYPAGDPRPGFDPRMRPDDRAGFRYRDDDDDRRFRRNDWDDRGRWDGRGKPPKRRSLLGELLEGLGD